MNIAVVAASGRSGQAFVKAALAANHTVRAGIHTKNPFSEQPNLTVIKCDATNPSDVEKLLAGTEAVVCLIGHSRNSPARLQSQAIQVILLTMKKLGISRLVSLTGTGVRLSGDKIPLIDHLLTFGVGIFDPKRVDDGIEHVKILQEDPLDWTVIRVLKLQNIKPRPFCLTEHGPTRLIAGRDEVAQAILQVLENHSFIRQAPMISKPA